MTPQEEVAAARAEQAAMQVLLQEIARRDRAKADGFVEVVEMFEPRIARAYGIWRRRSLERARLTFRVLGARKGTSSATE